MSLGKLPTTNFSALIDNAPGNMVAGHRSEITEARVQTNLTFSSISSTPSSSSRTSSEVVRPGMRLFEMQKQKKRAHWQFIRCVANEIYADVQDQNLRTKHAKHGWCTRCNVIVKVEKGNNDAGKHMLDYHPTELLEFERREEQERLERMAPPLTNAYAAPPAEPAFEGHADTTEQRVADDLLAMWIASSLRPMSIVQDPGFIRYMAFVNSVPRQLSIPSRQAVKDRIRQKAAQYRGSLKSRIAFRAECDFYTVSTDIWTSMNAESFMALTHHYLNENFDMFSWTLEVVALPGKHDAPSIARALKATFTSWALDLEKCTKFLRDGGSNITKGCEDMGVNHMSCIAHSLHLVVGAVLVRKLDDILEEDWMVAENANKPPQPDAIDGENDENSDIDEFVTSEDIEAICNDVASFVDSATVYRADLESVRRVVQRFRKLAVYLHRSQKGANRLKRLQHGVSVPLKVLTDCPTRWGSTMLMLRRLIELRPALDDFFVYLQEEVGSDEFSDARSKLLRPTSEEWFVIQCLVELLEPFSATTEELGGSNYPTLVCALPGIRSLKSMLQDQNIFASLSAAVQGEEFEPRVREMMESVRRSFIALVDKRFGEIDEELLWIPLLDPRFTNTELLLAAERSVAGERLVAEMLATAKLTADASSDVTSPVPPTNQDRPTPKKKMRVAYRSRLYGSRVVARPEATVDLDVVLLEECKWEFNKYVRDSAVVHDEIDPLKWWKLNRANFPRIAPLARKWLGYIATSVPSERAFSTAGNTITKRRSALKANTVRDILFIADNKIA